jgi:pimeloyl-ACP methyl ester carboxylesterase
MLAGGGGSATSAPDSTVISGVVSDDIIVGATVTATSLDTGLVLGTAITGADGSYSISLSTSAIAMGYTLSSAGGSMNGLAFEGSLKATYPGTWATGSANLTLITTGLVDAANGISSYVGTHLEKHEAIKADAIARGVLPPDYHLVAPSGTLMASLQNSVPTQGLAVTMANFAKQLSRNQTTTACDGLKTTCGTDVSASSGAFDMNLPGGIIHVDALALSNCHVEASFNETTRTLGVRVEKILGSPTSTTSGCISAGNITLTLTGSATQALESGACPGTGSGMLAKSMTQCVTLGSGFSTTYLVYDGHVTRHRLEVPRVTLQATVGNEISLSPVYGAILHSSLPPNLGTATAAYQWQNQTPVIFVHGFTPGGIQVNGITIRSDGYGGDDGTWGKLPTLVAEQLPSSVALNFQWSTQASYLTAAKDLAKAVDYAYLSTGKKVHIVAHSFGGVLSRVMLQNLTGTTASAAAKVATLTTVGAPHSGIVNGSPTSVNLSSGSVVLPVGWGSWAPDKPCLQITCYQSGLDAGVAQWAKDSLADSAPTGKGYVNARLGVTLSSLPADLTMRVLIGQIINQTSSPTFSTDDGLISYLGQRLRPSTTAPELLSNATFGGATVTERVLGLDATAGGNAAPGAPVNLNLMTAYAKNPSTDPSSACVNANKTGYKHSSRIAMKLTGGTDGCVENSEVNIPADCGTATTCQHDTWLNIKEVLPTAPISTLSQSFIDNFDGTSLQPAYWTAQGAGATTVVDGWASFACFARANTKDKVTFSGTKIVIEAGLIGIGHAPWGRDTMIALTDVANVVNSIQAGDTTYKGDGLYAYGGGIFNLAQSGNGISTSAYKEFRLTLDGTALTLERGDTLANITETVTRTLATSIVGKTFYLTIGTGGPDYCPGKFDWVKIATY